MLNILWNVNQNQIIKSLSKLLKYQKRLKHKLLECTINYLQFNITHCRVSVNGLNKALMLFVKYKTYTHIFNDAFHSTSGWYFCEMLLLYYIYTTIESTLSYFHQNYSKWIERNGEKKKI